MIKVLMEVDTHATRFTVPVLAESLMEAISTAKDCYPGNDIRVVFPIDPEEFFVGAAGAAYLLELEDRRMRLRTSGRKAG